MAARQDVAPAPGPPIMLRNALARTVYNKMLEDQAEQSRDHSYWYEIDRSKLPEDVCDKFIQFHEDVETKAFLKNSYDKSDAFFTQMFHLMAKSVLSWFMETTSINGLLKRGSMFVFSQHQFQQLLSIDSEWKAQTLLDLGAGDGRVTEKMESHFEEVYATEASTPMRWRLQERGYRLLEIDSWADGTHQFDVVSCLNLLDRCDRPLSILRDIKQVLRPVSGRLLVAVVLPFGPYVEFVSDGSHTPEQRIHLPGHTFEDHVKGFVQEVFAPLGYRLEAFSRAPYLCEGDMEHSFYMLSDALFLLSVDS